jgi:hypothetical protein
MYGLRLRNLTIRVSSFSCVAGPLGFLISFSFLVVPSALAAPLPVAVSPTRIEITASPGDQVESSFKFWNGTDADLPVHLEGADIGPQDEEGHATVEREDAANSLKAWLKPAYPDLNVAPKQEITLPFSVDVPASADPGSHWGALLAITSPVAQSNGAAVNVRTGVILLVHVLGPVTEKLVLESVTVPRFAESPPILIEARFRNEGTVHEAPFGNIEVQNMFDSLVATGTLSERNVLPGVVRKIETSVGQGVWLGRYTATLRGSYGDGKETLSATEEFWVVPWKQYGVHFLVGLALTAFVIWKRRRFGKVWYALRTGKPPPED